MSRVSLMFDVQSAGKMWLCNRKEEGKKQRRRGGDGSVCGCCQRRLQRIGKSSGRGA